MKLSNLILIQTIRNEYMLNATWIETFTVLAEEGHFTRAAERLNMTQPGVSQQLRKLESQIGKALILQEGKGFTLTPAGEVLKDLGLKRRVEERALRQAIGRDEPDIGELRVACSGSFAMMFYPQAIAMMREAEALSIHVEAAPSSRVLEGVLNGDFDLGVIDENPGHPRIAAQYIGREELCLVLPEGTPEPVGFGALEVLGLVAHPDAYSYADDLFSHNFPSEFSGADRLKIRTSVNQIGQIPTPVASGVGYTLLPRSGLSAFPDAHRIKIAKLPQPQFHELWLITRRAIVPSKRLHRVMKVALSLAETL